MNVAPNGLKQMEEQVQKLREIAKLVPIWNRLVGALVQSGG